MMNDDLTFVINKKWDLFKIWKRSGNEGDRKQYCETKKNVSVKRVVATAMDQVSRKAGEKIVSNCDGYNVVWGQYNL